MKLLSYTQGKNQKQIENSAQELRSSQLEKVLKDKRKEINDLDNSLVNSLSELTVRLQKEELEWREKINPLKEEVDSLERRKLQALIPLEEREKQVQYSEVALSKREHQVSKREQEAEDNLELLEGRLDDASERLSSIHIRQSDVRNAEDRIALKEKEVDKRMADLNQIIEGEYAKLALISTEQEKKRLELNGRLTVLKEAERRISSRELDLNRRESLLLDRQQTLEREAKEIKQRVNPRLNRTKR